MSELRKANTDYTYFLTLTVAGWIDIFTRQRYNNVIIESLKFCTSNKGLEIFAYVIMPSHIHLVARSLKGNLPEILRDFKSFTAKAILKMIEQEEGESRREWLLHMFKYYASFQKQNATYMFGKRQAIRLSLIIRLLLIRKLNMFTIILLKPDM
jgi:putative transposase